MANFTNAAAALERAAQPLSTTTGTARGWRHRHKVNTLTSLDHGSVMCGRMCQHLLEQCLHLICIKIVAFFNDIAARQALKNYSND